MTWDREQYQGKREDQVGLSMMIFSTITVTTLKLYKIGMFVGITALMAYMMHLIRGW